MSDCPSLHSPQQQNACCQLTSLQTCFWPSTSLGFLPPALDETRPLCYSWKPRCTYGMTFLAPSRLHIQYPSRTSNPSALAPSSISLFYFCPSSNHKTFPRHSAQPLWLANDQYVSAALSIWPVSLWYDRCSTDFQKYGASSLNEASNIQRSMANAELNRDPRFSSSPELQQGSLRPRTRPQLGSRRFFTNLLKLQIKLP